jgi:hypothetical protein
VRLVRALPVAALSVAIACSGGGKTGTFAVGTPSPRESSVVRQEAQSVSAGRIGAPSPARLFAGTASILGQLIRYCKESTCEKASGRSPNYLTARGGSFALFSIGTPPVEASAEVRTHPSDAPSTVKLNAGDLMVFNYGLGPGRYLIDLIVRWRGAEARWRFGLKITG